MIYFQYITFQSARNHHSWSYPVKFSKLNNFKDRSLLKCRGGGGGGGGGVKSRGGHEFPCG